MYSSQGLSFASAGWRAVCSLVLTMTMMMIMMMMTMVIMTINDGDDNDDDMIMMMMHRDPWLIYILEGLFKATMMSSALIGNYDTQ